MALSLQLPGAAKTKGTVYFLFLLPLSLYPLILYLSPILVPLPFLQLIVEDEI